VQGGLAGRAQTVTRGHHSPVWEDVKIVKHIAYCQVMEYDVM
jgi:hypothetical protein